ncbi:hypothetical protein BP5796_11920 [Coleophoma crateriformis]|uniref:Phytanoyl-CoA dioxygenase n=1 Tax=Coleophoma crateriformis TaxID=565419 RepID=A0A3D8QFX1_9HELO|nr:hypothetical protein BP5796_11920 [Coleophoma crateriformis]
MTTTTAVTSPVQRLVSEPAPDRLAMSGSSGPLSDWHRDLIRDGFAVVKGAVPKERADKYANDMYTWLEDFNLGFNRNDASTIHKDNLPVINEKGMCLHYAVTHEDFVWQVRSEPGVVGAFETVYNDKDIIVSFDAVGFGFPNRTDLPKNVPWPHQDQDPEKPGFRCLQGLVNLLPNGPDDGGLIVCKGAYHLSEQFHREMAWEDRIPQWTNEWYGFTENGMKWLADHGCEWVKVCAEPGDLLLWDSRVPHYNLSSTTSQPRFCVYTCYMPVADVTQDDLVHRVGTTHWPNARHVGGNVAKRDGEIDSYNRICPRKDAVLSERAFQLTGIPYIKAST